MDTLLRSFKVWWLRRRIKSRIRNIQDLRDYLQDRCRASSYYDAEVRAHIAEQVEQNRADSCRIATL